MLKHLSRRFFSFAHKTSVDIVPLQIETCAQRAASNIDRDIDVTHGILSIRRTKTEVLAQDTLIKIFIEGRLGRQLVVATVVCFEKAGETSTRISYEADIPTKLIRNMYLASIVVFVISVSVGFAFTGFAGLPLGIQFFLILLLIVLLTFTRIIALRDLLLKALNDAFSKPTNHP